MKTRKVVIALSIFVAAPLVAQDLQVPDFVRLPGVYTKKEEPAARRIDFQRVSECVADDAGLHARAISLAQLETSVKRESADIDVLGEELKASDAALRDERPAFDELVNKLKARDIDLREAESLVKRLGEDRSTREKVEIYNAAVDGYNAEVRKRNLQLGEVKRAQADFKKQVDAHNAKVQEQHRRIDAFNARSTAFSATANELVADVGKFDSDCLISGR